MKKIFSVLAAAVLLVIIGYLINRNPLITVDKSERFEQCSNTFKENIVSRMNSEDVLVTVVGSSVEEFDYDFYVSEDMKLMVEAEFLKSLMSCSVLEYSDKTVLVMKGDNTISLTLDSNEATVNSLEDINLGSVVYKDEKTSKIYIPLDGIAQYLNYSVDYALETKWIDMSRTGEDKLLPDSYDMRDFGRVTPVRDQGRYGTCWAFASLGALETTMLPNEKNIFSTDHMSICNSYNLDLNKGGEHTMSIAYLAAWQGPVYEDDDPYGDGVSDDTLAEVKHLEEALVINDRDFDVLKSAVFRYGAIETSLYSQMEYVDSISSYFSAENDSYYYDGEEIPNHDVVVVGWDDNYSKENFTNEPEGDGAFICKNSWGEEFGDKGYFYVSYYDSNICNKSVVYTRVGDADNYDKIYQSDLLGWIGLMGFGKEDAYFSNVYTADKNEEIAAVSFYATGKDTKFEVYLVQNFIDESSLKNREFIVSGSTKYAGYYTVDFPEAVRLSDNSKYAVVVKISTPGAVHPIAIEYNADERTANFDISDGEGYISLYGELWHSAEDTQNCNVCLKAFTNYVQNDDTKPQGDSSNIDNDSDDTENSNSDEGGSSGNEPEINTEDNP